MIIWRILIYVHVTWKISNLMHDALINNDKKKPYYAVCMSRTFYTPTLVTPNFPQLHRPNFFAYFMSWPATRSCFLFQILNTWQILLMEAWSVIPHDSLGTQRIKPITNRNYSMLTKTRFIAKIHSTSFEPNSTAHIICVYLTFISKKEVTTHLIWSHLIGQVPVSNTPRNWLKTCCVHNIKWYSPMLNLIYF